MQGNDTTTLLTSTPPLAVFTANCLNLSLPDVVQLATLFYLALLIIHKLFQMTKEWRSERKKQAGHDESV